MSLMRIRSIKPCFFTHDGLYELEKQLRIPVRVAFAGLWCASDREGRFEWKPRALKAVILPYDDCDFAALLDALCKTGYIVRYESEGRSFGLIPRFKVHQSINPKESASIIPPPDEKNASVTRDPREKIRIGTRDPRVSDAPSLREGKGSEGKGSEEKNTPLPPEGSGPATTEGTEGELSQEEAEARHFRDYCRKEAKGLPMAFLDDATFRDTWCDWIAHLKARHHKGFNPPFTTVSRHKEQIRAHSVADAIWALEEGIRRNLPFPADPSKRPAADPAPSEYEDFQSVEATPEQRAADLEEALHHRLPLPTPRV